MSFFNTGNGPSPVRNQIIPEKKVQYNAWNANRARKSTPKSKPKRAKISNSNVPEGALMIGDSMIRNLNPDNPEFIDMELFLFAYPGITADDLNTTIISEFLPPPSRIGTVVLHAGCNNASTRNLTQPIDEAAQAVFACMDTLADFYPAAKMWVSGILPRLDDDNDRAKEINELVKTHCQKLPDEAVQYIDFSIDFINKDRSIKKKLFRFSEGHEEDAVHLGSEGNIIFSNLISVLLSHTADERQNLKVNEDHLFDQKTFDDWRIENYDSNFKEKKRFRVTNWGPAINNKNPKPEKSPRKKNEKRKSSNMPSRERKSVEKKSSNFQGYNNGGYNNGEKIEQETVTCESEEEENVPKYESDSGEIDENNEEINSRQEIDENNEDINSRQEIDENNEDINAQQEIYMSENDFDEFSDDETSVEISESNFKYKVEDSIPSDSEFIITDSSQDNITVDPPRKIIAVEQNNIKSSGSLMPSRARVTR